MFDINEFMNAPVTEEIVTIRRGTEDFKIKRLNGAERLKFNDLTGQYERTLFVISHALLSGAQNAPIGEQNAARFIERYGSLAEALFNDIFDQTVIGYRVSCFRFSVSHYYSYIAARLVKLSGLSAGARECAQALCSLSSCHLV